MAANDKMPPVAVSMGDPAGIGLDIVIAALHGAQKQALASFVLIADPLVLQQRAAQLGCAVPVTVLSDGAPELIAPAGTLGIVSVPCAAPVIAGAPNAANAAATIASIERAARLVKDGRASALLTNPIAKSVLVATGFTHPGHTEFLGELAARYWNTQVQPVMMLVSADLKVVPVTLHIPLASVPRQLTRELIVTTARTAARALITDFGIAKPRLAICGLNPHAGEEGLMGSEERTIISPAIDELRQAGLAVTGPHPADTLFHAAARTKYDAVLAMYHDQALIPLKTIAFDTGVNVTLGLPFVRTSPDHGTAFDIAGSGRASPASFAAALAMASAIARQRTGQVA